MRAFPGAEVLIESAPLLRQKEQLIVRDIEYQMLSDPASTSHLFKMSATRVAIAGTGGLAYLIAHYILNETSYPLILLAKEVSLARTAGDDSLSTATERRTIPKGPSHTCRQLQRPV